MIGILIMTIIAIIFGIILVNLDNIFPKNTLEIEKLLPGYNCGACGYKGCANLSEAIFENPNLYTKCRVLKGENLLKMQEYLKEKYEIDIK